jgi:tetratricopeptide (TPR) repeat protein
MVVDEYVKRGKTREAGDVLKKLAEIDPADLKIRSKLADLYTREGNSAKAVDEHVAIAEELNKKGHLAEALQVLEKGLKIDANSVRLKTELGRVHLVQKNYDKAVQYLEEASRQSPKDAQALARLGEAYLGAKKTKEAEATFKRALELDPQDQDAGAQMARVHLAQGHFDKAFDQLLPVVNRLVERREGERGAALLQQIVQKNPAHVKSLVKLVEIYGQLGKESAAATASSHLTEAYINQGQFAEAATILEGLVARDPQNQQHRSKLQMVRTRLTGGRAAAAPAAPASTEEPLAFEEEELDLSGPPTAAPVPSVAPAPAARPAAPVARPAIEVSGPLSEEDQEFVEEHLAEGKVFRKYGLLDKAADQFEAVIARFPDNVDARQELRDVYKEKEQPAKAAEQSLALAEIFRLKGDKEMAQTHEAEAGSAAPAAVPAAALPKKAAAAAAPPAPAPAPRAEPEEEEVISIDEEAEAAPALEEAAEELPSFDLVEAEPEVEAEAEELETEFVEDETAPDVAAAEEIELSGADEAEAPAEAAFSEASFMEAEELALEEPEPEPAPPPPPAPLRAAPPKPAPPPPAPARSAAAAAKAPPPAAPGLPADLQKVLDEVDSYVSLGFVEDAVEALQEIAARYPDHPALLAKMSDLGLDRAALEKREEEAPEEARIEGALGDLGLEGEAEPAFEDAEATESALEPESLISEQAPAEAEASPFEGAGDLGAELDELFGAQAAVEEPPSAAAAATELGDAGLADIFKEFKKGVDKQLGKEDYDTRYNLGIAYKEMGLIDEAIAEFQLAAKDESRTLECSSMLGICFMDKGMPKLAVKWFEKGLKAPDRSDEEYQGLRYDLAMAHEAAGEMDKALHLFTDLYGQDANFRDVAAKVRDLRAALR